MKDDRNADKGDAYDSAGGLCLDQRCSDRSPLRLNTDDKRNSHTPETAVGARLMGRPSRRSTPVAPVSAQPARERSLLPAILQMLTCGLWSLSTSVPTGSDPIPSMSRSAPSRRFIASANADRLSVLDSSMSLLPFRRGSRTLGALCGRRCSDWNSAAALLPDPRTGIPKPADCHRVRAWLGSRSSLLLGPSWKRPGPLPPRYGKHLGAARYPRT
jgi:hypothetical protein